MNNYKLTIKLIIIASQFFYFTNIYAATLTQVPADLTYAGKPIDSLCFFNLETNTTTIDLRHCGAAKEKYIAKRKNAYLISKSFIGYDWQDPSISSQICGYSYYHYFDASNKHFWIYTINSGGGSGEFTTLLSVKRQDENTLAIDDIAGGDRCNGGIQDVAEKNHTLTFSINLTPYDLLALSNQHANNIKAYDDLAACATCCIAKAFYTINTDSRPQLTFVNIANTTNITEMPTQGKYQVCFNKLLKSYLEKNKNHFNKEKINDFAYRFKKTCGILGNTY